MSTPIWTAELVYRISRSADDPVGEYATRRIQDHDYTILTDTVADIVADLPISGFVRWININIHQE